MNTDRQATASEANTLQCLLCGESLFSHEAGESGICQQCAERMLDHFVIKCSGCESVAYLRKSIENFERLNASLEMEFAWDDFVTSILVIMASNCPDCHGWDHSLENKLIH
jgi:hypothetical protein